jgi:L-rhamnonate dehydratase
VPKPKIADVRAFYIRSPDIDLERTDSSQDALIVQITTDTGVVGYGEVDSAPQVAKAVIELQGSHRLARGLRQVLLGQDPLQTEQLWTRMHEATLYYGRDGAAIHAMAGVDIALWDLKGKILGEPIHVLMGGSYRTEIRAYASSLFGATPEETAKLASSAVEHGFTAVKLGWEPFGFDPAVDVAHVAAAREAVGPEVELLIDAGMAWDAKTALARLKLFEPYRLFWLEEPLHPDDLHGYRRLTARADTRIAAGEEESTVAGFRRLMDEGGVDVVQIDVTRVGLTQALKIAAMAAERGLPCVNHTFTTDINVAASLHFLAAIPNAFILEYCVEDDSMRRTLVREPIQVLDGIAKVPDTPGLGIEVRPEGLEQFAVDDREAA